ECRANDRRSLELTRALNDAASWSCCEAERAFAQRLEGSCQSPIAGFAQIRGDELSLVGVIGSPDGREVYRDTQRGPIADALSIGRALADRMLDAGARALLDRLRSEP